MKTKYDKLHYREISHPLGLRNEWLRCQIGRVRLEKRDPRRPADPVFELIGYGKTMFAAEEMVEKKLGRVIEMDGNGRLP